MLIMLCLLPLGFHKTVMSLFTILIATFLCSLPFYFFGIITTTALTKSSLPIGKLYAFDLIGASLGCLFALIGLENLDAPSLLLLCASFGTLAGLCFSETLPKEKKKSTDSLLRRVVSRNDIQCRNSIPAYGRWL